MKTYNIYSLGELDLLKEDSFLKIPSIQRGLVWKPKQVEMLWDSLLRGFPIGTFTVLLKDGSSSDGDLVDGQQRLNAIISGFTEPDAKSESVVWIDLMFMDEARATTRKYGVRVTTRAHPWGYNLDGSVLTASERREAIINAGIDKEKQSRKTVWNILDFGPSKDSCLPVPLSCVLYSGSVKELQDKCSLFSDKAPFWKDKYLQKVLALQKNDLDTLWADIERLHQDAVVAIPVRTEDDLEILFERIGTGGTPITSRELAYAAMKQYLDKDGEIKRINERLKNRPVSEADFAMFVFRLFFSGKDNIDDDISVQKVRNISRDETKCAVIRKAYKDDGNEIQAILNKVDEWLLGSGFPAIIRSEIAWSNSKLYVFLMWMALQEINGIWTLDPGYMRALACYLHVCVRPHPGRNKERYRPWVVEYLYKNLNKLGKNDAPDIHRVITSMIDEMVNFGWCMSPVDTFNDFDALKDEKVSETWAYTNYSRTPHYDLFAELFPYPGNRRSQFVLKLFLKDYYRKYFGEYDPSRADLWSEINRPWDHDHIIPQDWGKESGEWQKCVEQLLNGIGNIADIPFELNRGKGNKCEWDHYEEKDNASLLGVDRSVFSIFKDKETASGLTQDKDLAYELFSFVKGRFLAMTDSFMSIISPLGIGKVLSGIAAKRKEFLTEIKRNMPQTYALYYVLDGVEIPFSEDDSYAWSQQWISLGEDQGDSFMPAVTVGIESHDCLPYLEIEYGMRKSAQLDLSELNTWWKQGHYHHFSEKESRDLEVCKQIVLNYLNSLTI